MLSFFKDLGFEVLCTFIIERYVSVGIFVNVGLVLSGDCF